MLLDRIFDMRQQLRGEAEFRAQFHEADKERAVLKEKLKTRIASEIMFGFALTVGSLLIGFAPSLWSTWPYGAIMLWSGIGLLLTGLVTHAIILR